MDPIPAMKETISVSWYRIKGIAIYFKYFKDLLCQCSAQDESMRGFVDDVIQDCERLDEKIRLLLEKVHEISDSTPQTSSERRQVTRFNVEGEATLVFNREESKTYAIKDLSLNGVGLIGNHPLDLSNSLDVVIASPFLRNSYFQKVRLAWQKKLGENLWEGGLVLTANN
jgi:hypothetical protein